MAAPYYNHWRKNLGSYRANAGDFQKHLLAGEVEAFDFTQDCNMSGEYTRCFYKLADTKIYQETPCDNPRVQWKRVEGKLTRHYHPDQLAVWDYIDAHFTATCSDFQVRYERIEIKIESV